MCSRAAVLCISFLDLPACQCSNKVQKTEHVVNSMLSTVNNNIQQMNMSQEQKAARKARKSALTREINAVERFIAENDFQEVIQCLF